MSNIKECTTCKIYLKIENFRVRIQHGKEYRVARCKKCEGEINKLQRDPEKRRQADSKRFADPSARERKNKYQMQWRAKNIEKNREYHKKHIKKNVDELTDIYVSRTMYRRKFGLNIPEELLQTKRTHLKLKRIIRQLKNGTKQNKRP